MKSPVASGVVAALLIALLTVGAVAALTADGAGGEEQQRLTKAEYKVRAAAACTKAFTALGKAGSGLPTDRPPTDDELSAFNDARQKIFATMLADLESVLPPKDDDDAADELNELVARSAELDDVFITTYIALPEGQSESPELVAVQAEFQPVVDELKAVASRLGVPACAGS